MTRARDLADSADKDISGTLVLDDITLSNDISIADNGKAIFGAGSDLQIYHDGSASYIDDVGTGVLNIQSNGTQINIQKSDGTKMIEAINNGNVVLYSNGVERVRTNGTGIDVSGTVTADGLTVDGATKISAGSPTLRLTETDTTDVNTRITAGSGQLFIQTENDAENSRTDRLKIDHSTGDISFYEDTGTTAKLTWSASDEALEFADNAKAIFGSGSDLQIYHDGSNSIIDETGTGNLKIVAQDFILNSQTPANMITAYQGAYVSLFYDGSPKLATSASGIDVTGTVTADSLTVSQENPKITITDTGTGADHELNGSSSIGNLTLNFDKNDEGSSPYFYIQHAGSKLAAFRKGGDISFYEDTGTTAKFFWDASAESLGIGTSSPTAALDVRRVDADGKIAEFHQSSGYGFTLSSSQTVASIESGYLQDFVFKTGSTATERMRIESDGDIAFGNAGSNNYSWMRPYETTTGNLIISSDQGATGVGGSNIVFRTRGADKMVIQHSGNVGIGTSSPDKNLHIEGSDPTFRLTNPQSTSSLGLSMGKIEWETRDASAPGVIGYIDVVDSNNFGTTFDMAFATGQSGSATERMRIDSSGNVGIGVTNPSDYYSTKLVVDAEGGEDGITIVSSTAAEAYLMFADGTSGDAQYRGYVSYSHANDYLRFATSGAERMRIDSSGNLLVGKTSAGYATDGFEARSNGETYVSRSGTPMAINRNSSDGTLLNFYKTGAPVGGIGTSGGDVYIGTGTNASVRFNDGVGALTPASGTANADNAVSLGYSTLRWKNLHLSGVGYVGTTQEANTALSGTTPSIDADTAGSFTLTTSGNTTFTFASVTSGRSVGFVLKLTAGGGHTITWPSSVDWAGGTAPDAPASGETDVLAFYTVDGGTNWYGALAIDAAA